LAILSEKLSLRSEPTMVTTVWVAIEYPSWSGSACPPLRQIARKMQVHGMGFVASSRENPSATDRKCKTGRLFGAARPVHGSMSANLVISPCSD
jgi:hypothetical protein